MRYDTMMDSFMEHLLSKHDVDSSNVTIVDDNASLELSAALFLLSQPATTSSSPPGSISSDTTNNATNKPCRWSNITDDMNDLRIAKRIVSDLRRSWSSPSTTSTSASTSQSKPNFDINNQGSSSVAVASRTISSNRNHQFKSFPANRGRLDNRSNAGWDDNTIWNDVSSPSTTFEAREDKLKQQFISSSDHDDDDNDDDDDSMTEGGEEEEIESDDDDDDYDDDASKGSIEEFLQNWAVRQDLDSNTSIEKLLSPSSVYKQNGGSSADMTDATYGIDSSYQSILDYNKLVSNIHTRVSNYNHQAPRLPQRKNSFDDTAVASPDQQQPERISSLNILPFITNASEIVSTGKKISKKKKKSESSTKKQKKCASLVGSSRTFGSSKSMKRGIGSNDHDHDHMRVQRLRDALGPMTPTSDNCKMANNDGDNDDDDIDCTINIPNIAQWWSCRSKIKANTRAAAAKKQRLSPPLSPPGTPKRRGGGKRIDYDLATMPYTGVMESV